MRPRRALALVLVALAVILLMARRPAARAPRTVAQAATAPRATWSVVSGAPAVASDDVVAEVRFEKRTVCVGQSVGYAVTLGGDEATRPWLTVRMRVGGSNISGPSGVITPSSAWLDPDLRAQMDRPSVEVYDGRSGALLSTRAVDVQVADCGSTSRNELIVSCLDGQPDAESATCHVVPADGFVPTHFAWTIAPAVGAPPLQEAQSPGPEMTFGYPARVVDRLQSTQVVTVVARDAAGQERQGRTTLAIINHAYRARDDGRLELAIIAPPYPAVEGGKTYVTVGRLMNPQPEAVRLDGLNVKVTPCDGKTPTIVELHPASELVGQTVLPPGSSVPLRFTQPMDATRCSATIELVGQGVDSGLPVSGLFTMPMDPAQFRKVTPPEMARVSQALAILSQRRGEKVTRVSTDELNQLEGEGLLPHAEIPGVMGMTRDLAHAQLR